MKLLSVGCARPNFVKLAAISHACRQFGDIEHMVVHTGQHYDPLFSDVFFEQLDIEQPIANLGVHLPNREEVIAVTAEKMEAVLHEHQPDWVLVYGDVNGAVGAARAAKKIGVPLAHIEAGLRSFDVTMPEEVNRIEIDQVADVLFCTEQSGVENIKKEKITGQVELVGNTMIDTLIRMLPLIDQQQLGINLPSTYIVATLHRPSNVDTKQALTENINFFNTIAEYCQIILPAHHRLKAHLDAFDLHKNLHKSIRLIEPLGYIQFLHLIRHCVAIITDSGGIQEEAAYLQKRCFTLRRNTERPVTIDCGCNTLIDPINCSADVQKVLEYLQHPELFSSSVPAMWDGKAGQRIVSWLVKH